MTDLDWGEMEGLFCQQATNTQGSPKLGANRDSSGGGDTLERKQRKENSEVIMQKTKISNDQFKHKKKSFRSFYWMAKEA